MFAETSLCNLTKDEPDQLTRLFEQMLMEIDAELERIREFPSQPPSDKCDVPR